MPTSASTACYDPGCTNMNVAIPKTPPCALDLRAIGIGTLVSVCSSGSARIYALSVVKLSRYLGGQIDDDVVYVL